MKTFGDLFTDRQLVALNTFSELVHEARKQIEEDALTVGHSDEPNPLREGGTGAKAYAEAVSVYLALSISSRCTDFNNSLTGWSHSNQKVMHLFNRQAIPMVWDFAEANILENVVGGFLPGVNFTAKCLGRTSH